MDMVAAHWSGLIDTPEEGYFLGGQYSRAHWGLTGQNTNWVCLAGQPRLQASVLAPVLAPVLASRFGFRFGLPFWLRFGPDSSDPPYGNNIDSPIFTLTMTEIASGLGMGISVKGRNENGYEMTLERSPRPLDE